jgi:hypothetical protein
LGIKNKTKMDIKLNEKLDIKCQYQKKEIILKKAELAKKSLKVSIKGLYIATLAKYVRS